MQALLEACSTGNLRHVLVHHFEPFGPFSLREVAAVDHAHLFNYSTVAIETKRVYLFGEYTVEFPLQNEECMVTQGSGEILATQSLATKYCCMVPFKNLSISMECKFTHATDETQAVVSSAVQYFWYWFSASIFVCSMPTEPVDLRQYIPSVVVSSALKQYTMVGSSPVRALAAHAKRHLLCSCLQVWRRWTFLLEYLKYHREVHGLSHTIIISQDMDTFEALPWLQTMFSIEGSFEIICVAMGCMTDDISDP